MTRLFAVILAGLSLTGCATIMEGTGQSVAVSTTPAGAQCDASHAGTHLGTVAATPGSLRIDKSKNDLQVTCAKNGYQRASSSYSPGFVGTTFGNLLVGGVVGVVVDAASGANYTYPKEVHMDLAPIAPGVSTIAPPVTPAMVTATVPQS